MKKFIITTLIIVVVALLSFLYYQQKSKPTFLIHDAFLPTTGEFAKESIYIPNQTPSIKFNIFHDEQILTVLDRIKNHEIDGAFTGAYWFGAKDPVLYLLSCVPFHLSLVYIHDFVKSKIGQKLYNEIGARHNIKIFPSGITGMQVNGWWKQVPKTINDIKGINMRMPGLAGVVFERLGAKLHNHISPEKLFDALKEDKISVVEWTTPASDLEQGFYKLAPNGMVPGWHEPGTIIHFILSLDKWKSLSQKQQHELEEACEYSLLKQSVEIPRLEGRAMEEIIKKGGRFVQWPTEFLQAFYKTFSEIADEFAKQDPLFAEYYHAIQEFTKINHEYLREQEVPLLNFIEKHT